MNILFVTYDFPYPTNSGGKNRAYHMLKHTARSVNIFLYSFVREDYNPNNNEEILKLNIRDIKVFKRKKLVTFSNFTKTIIHNTSIFKTLYFDKKAFTEMVTIIKSKKIDIVHFESSYTGFYIVKELRRLGVKVVLGTENIEFLLYLDYAKSLKRFYLKPFVHFQANKLKVEELQMVKNADVVTTITQGEADTLKQLTGVNCEIVTNGIEPDLYKYEIPKVIKNNILFVGNFDYFPNVDAINFFYKDVFHKLDNKITLTIIGKNIHQKFKPTHSRIIKKDFVDDLISEYRNCDLLVFPIRIGGGTNFKVLEAMSLGVPIIAQPERLAGLNAHDEEHFLKATNGREYVDQIKRIYEDEKLREKLVNNARSLIEKHYSWDKIGLKLLNIWSNEL